VNGIIKNGNLNPMDFTVIQVRKCGGSAIWVISGEQVLITEAEDEAIRIAPN